MKYVFLLLMPAMSYSFASETYSMSRIPKPEFRAKSLDCVEGKLRLKADFIKQRVDILEYDSLIEIERSLFNGEKMIRFSHLYYMRFNPPYYFLRLEIKNDGLISGEFKNELNTDTNSRIGRVKYEGWFSWEPIYFKDCELKY